MKGAAVACAGHCVRPPESPAYLPADSTTSRTVRFRGGGARARWRQCALHRRHGRAVHLLGPRGLAAAALGGVSAVGGARAGNQRCSVRALRDPRLDALQRPEFAGHGAYVTQNSKNYSP